MITSQILAAQEMFRAKAIIDKANMYGEDIAKSLRDHMVSQAIIRQLVGESYEYAPKKKRGNSEAAVIDWARSRVGESTNPAEIAEATGLSYATTNKIVGLRSDWFNKVKKGHYIVRDPEAERVADKAGD